MLFGTNCWSVKKQHIHKISIVKMRMLRHTSENTQKSSIQNEKIRLKIREILIDEKIRESCLRWVW